MFMIAARGTVKRLLRPISTKQRVAGRGPPRYIATPAQVIGITKPTVTRGIREGPTYRGEGWDYRRPARFGLTTQARRRSTGPMLLPTVIGAVARLSATPVAPWFRAWAIEPM